MQLTIHLSAARPGVSETRADVAGDVLSVNGVTYDLSAVPENGRATAQGDHPFAGPITRVDGMIHAAILWNYDSSTALADQGARHPVVKITDGPVPDPVLRREERT